MLATPAEQDARATGLKGLKIRVGISKFRRNKVPSADPLVANSLAKQSGLDYLPGRQI